MQNTGCFVLNRARRSNPARHLPSAFCILHFEELRKLFAHPRTQTTRLIVRRTLAIASVILAVAFILTLTMDIGTRRCGSARRAAGTNYLKRSMHIGELSVRLWDGAYVVAT